MKRGWFVENLAKLVREVLQSPEAEVKNIIKMGGMTNMNYQVTINSRNYVVRLPGNGTGEFINRKEEKDNLEFSYTLGINPELLYFDVETGLKITEKIVDATTLTKDLAKKAEVMAKVIQVFQTLHTSKVQMKNRFDLFRLMNGYEQLAFAEKVTFFDGFEEVKKDVMALKEYYKAMKVEEAPCHIDPTCANFIRDGQDKIYLIDWEYGGMFDPLWDLAAHSLESGFSVLEEEFFLKTYFQRDLTKGEAERILAHKIFQDYLWSIWTLFKEAKGDDFGAYGKNRFERAKKNIALFKETYGK